MKGYKVFNPDWTCRGKQYACPGVFEEDVELYVCKSGMHFCKCATNCFNYYRFAPENHVAEVEACGDVVEEGDKCCTNKLKIIREIPWSKLLEIVNTGMNCTGFGNTGDRNTGDGNTGFGNTGDRNTGDGNTGDWNTGNWNTGNWNTGDWNTGNWNTGDWNKTSWSSGCFNTKEQYIYLFDKQSDWTYANWRLSKAYYVLADMPFSHLECVAFIEMTEDEKNAHPEAATTGSFLRLVSVTPPERQQWWDGLPDVDKNEVKSLPNFDAKIFKEITGIEVNTDE